MKEGDDGKKEMLKTKHPVSIHRTVGTSVTSKFDIPVPAMLETNSKVWPVFAPFEVVIHNKPEDCWLSFLGKVLNVTSLVKLHEGEAYIKPILAFAGKDVSNWFDEATGAIQHYIHPVTGVRVPYCPHGPLPDIAYEAPTTLWRPIGVIPWWRNERYQVGVLTKCVRTLRIINTIICKEVHLDVCCEDTFERILERYSPFNKEATSYTWRYNDKNLDMSKTMSGNGIVDDRDHLADIGIPKSMYTPCIFLYYNDDLKHFEELED